MIPDAKLTRHNKHAVNIIKMLTFQLHGSPKNAAPFNYYVLQTIIYFDNLE